MNVNYTDDKLPYILTNIDRGVLITFTKDSKDYQVRVESLGYGCTTIDDYYKYEDLLTHGEFTELEQLINVIGKRVSRMIK